MFLHCIFKRNLGAQNMHKIDIYYVNKNGVESKTHKQTRITQELKKTQKYLSPHWGPVKLICPYIRLYVRLYVSMSLCLSVKSPASLFGNNKSAARNWAQHMRPQATGSNTLSGSRICPFVRLSGRPRSFCDFCISINTQNGVQRNPVGSSLSCM